jgi:hypothetical protein
MSSLCLGIWRNVVYYSACTTSILEVSYSRINFMQFGGKIVVCVFLLTRPEAVFGLAASNLRGLSLSPLRLLGYGRGVGREGES